MRLRSVTTKQCLTCRRTVFTSAEERQLVALHRMEHARADRRRAQWRASKERKRSHVVGGFHSVSCRRFLNRESRCNCSPIPVYRREVA